MYGAVNKKLVANKLPEVGHGGKLQPKAIKTDKWFTLDARLVYFQNGPQASLRPFVKSVCAYVH